MDVSQERKRHDCVKEPEDSVQLTQKFERGHRPWSGEHFVNNSCSNFINTCLCIQLPFVASWSKWVFHSLHSFSHVGVTAWFQLTSAFLGVFWEELFYRARESASPPCTEWGIKTPYLVPRTHGCPATPPDTAYMLQSLVTTRVD
jgi:hypothetical protein